MRILVTQDDGTQEVLTIVGPLTLTETVNPANGMGHITDATGTSYWFNEADGTYDGWSKEVKEGESETTNELVERVEESREYVHPVAGDD